MARRRHAFGCPPLRSPQLRGGFARPLWCHVHQFSGRMR
jgi:hypothetical protein